MINLKYVLKWLKKLKFNFIKNTILKTYKTLLIFNSCQI